MSQVVAFQMNINIIKQVCYFNEIACFLKGCFASKVLDSIGCLFYREIDSFVLVG